MNKKNTALKNILIISLSIVSIITSLAIVVLYSGYKIDIKYLRLLKTGSLYVNTSPKGADIYVNNEKVGSKTPFIINHLKSQKYNIKISKNGYKTWEKDIEITPEITTFLEYELIPNIIDTTSIDNITSDSNIVFSKDNKYILYKNKEEKVNKLYLYELSSKDKIEIYKTDKEISKFEFIKNSSDVLIEIDKNFIVINTNISRLTRKSDPGIISIYNYVKDVVDVKINNTNNSLLLKDKNKNIYTFDISSKKISKVNNKNVNKVLLYYNNSIIFSDNNSDVFNQSLFSNEITEIEDSKGVNDAFFYKDFIVLKTQDYLYLYKKNIDDKRIKILAKDIKYENNYIAGFSDYEVNIYDEKDENIKISHRYSKKIKDIDFYNKDYVLIFFENEIKLLNFKDNVNEISILDEVKGIEKGFLSASYRVDFIKKDSDNSYSINYIELQ